VDRDHFLLLLVNSVYVRAFASPTIFYMTNVLFHLALGTALFVVFAWMLASDKGLRNGSYSFAGLFLMSFLFGAFVTVAGNTLDHRGLLWLHIAFAMLGTLAFGAYVLRRARTEDGNWLHFRNGFVACLGVLLALPVIVASYQKLFPNLDDRIHNPLRRPGRLSGPVCRKRSYRGGNWPCTAQGAVPPASFAFSAYHNGKFENASSLVGADFSRNIVARGAAYADFDREGDLDLLITTNDGPAYFYRNDGGNRNHWISIRTVGSKSNRDGIGAIVRIETRSGKQWNRVRSGSSYCSQSELALTFGLGQDANVSAIQIEWPSGSRQTVTNMAADEFLTIDEARGVISKTAK